MSSNRASSSGGGVRNLRAMFENHSEQASPEIRGRSPAGSIASNGERPISRVRTSFVAVEPSAQVARTLSRTDSQQRESSRAVSERSTSIAEEPLSSSPSFRRSIPEASESEAIPPPIETIMSKIKRLSDNNNSDSTANPDKPTSTAEDTEVELKPADPKDESAVSGGHALPPPAEKIPPLAKLAAEKETDSARKDAKAEPEVPSQSPAAKSTPTKMNGTPKPTRSIAQAAKMTPSKPSPSPAIERPSRPSPVSAKKGPPELSQPNSKPTPPAPDGPITPTSPTAPKPSSTKSTAPSSARPTSSFMKPTSTSAAHHPQTNGTTKPTRPSFRSSTASTTSVASTARDGTRSVGGFVKPRARSPTRAINLPAHLVAHTASSSAKYENDGSAPAHASPGLARKTSVRSLASTRAPPRAPNLNLSSRDRRPKKEEPASRAPSSAAPDESFLARMRRPTASSSSKVRDIVELPPMRPRTRAEVTRKPKSRASGHKKRQSLDGVSVLMDASFIEDDTVWEEPTPATEEPPAHAEPAPTEPEQVGWMEEKTDVEEHRAEAPAAAAE